MIARMADEEFHLWLDAWRARCQAALDRLEVIFRRAGV